MPKRRSWGTIKHVSKDKHVIRYIDAQGARKSVTFYGTRREAEAGDHIMPKRRSWGTIKHVSKDKHVIRYIDAQGARKSVTFYGTRREAEAELARLRLMHERNPARRKAPTVSQAAEAWWLPWLEREFADGGISANTRKAYLYAWKRSVEPRWGGVRLDAAKASDVQSWLLELTRSNARNALVVLRKIADFAVKRDLLQSCAFALSYDLPKASRARSKDVLTLEEADALFGALKIADFAVKRDLLQSCAFALSYDLPKASRARSKDVLTLEEADALFGALRGSVVEAPFIAACFGSCRTGESLGIRVEEVEREYAHGITLAVAQIERQMPVSGHEPTDMLKTDASRRIIVIPGKWGERFLEIAEERSAVGSEWMADRRDGLPLCKDVLGRQWRKHATEDAPPFSNLRNSWRTFAQAEWRIDYDLLETLMGHRLEGVTGRHYLRFTREQIVEQFAREYAEAMVS